MPTKFQIMFESSRRLHFKLLPIIWLILVTVCGFYLAQKIEKNLDEGFEKINDLLIKRLPTNEDLVANLDLVFKKFNSLHVSRPLLWIGPWNPKIDLNFREALGLFFGLKQIIDSKECTKHDKFFIINSLPNAANIHRYSPNPRDEFRKRVELIFYLVSKQQAERCKQIWPQKFNQEYSKLNKTMINLAEGFKEKSLAKKPVMTDRGYMEWLIDQKPLSNPNDVIYAVQHVRKFSIQDKMRNNVRLMYQKYLHYPCFQYRVTIGHHILEQAEFSSEMFPQGKDGYILDDDSLVKFYQSLAYYRNCKKLCLSREFRKKVIDELESYSNIVSSVD